MMHLWDTAGQVKLSKSFILFWFSFLKGLTTGEVFCTFQYLSLVMCLILSQEAYEQARKLAYPGTQILLIGLLNTNTIKDID